MRGLVVPPARRLQELGRGPAGPRLSVLLSRRPGLALRPAAVLPDAVPFQDDFGAIIDEPPPRRMRAANLLVASLLTTLVLAASLLRVDTVVEATGRLAADGRHRPAADGARDRPRPEGQGGRRGAEGAGPGHVRSHLQPGGPRDADGPEPAALGHGPAPRGGAGRRAAPADGASEPAAAAQATLYRERRAQYAARLLALDEAVRRSEADIRAAREDGALLVRQLAVARDVEAMYGKLFADRTGSRLQYLQAQATTVRTEREARDADNRLAPLQHDLEARRAERAAFAYQWRGDLLGELAHGRDALAEAENALAKASRLRDLVVVAAPEDGVVLGVAPRSPGSVLREAEPLVWLLPLDAALIADVAVDSRDVGYLRPGDEVAVKVDAFPYQRHGLLRGTLRSVGQESFAAGGGVDHAEPPAPPGRFHRAQVVLATDRLHNLPDGARLITGMTVTAAVKVGTRRVISYILEPITRGFDESIPEP